MKKKPKYDTNWDDKIAELEAFFKDRKLPPTPIRLNRYTTMLNPELFVNAHLQMVTEQNGNPTFLPYLNRLQEFKEALQKISP